QSGGTVTVQLGTIAAGATVSGTIVVTPTEEGTVAANTVSVTSDLLDNNPGDNSATAPAVTVTDPQVIVSAGALVVQAAVDYGTLVMGTFTDPGGAEITATPEYALDVAYGDGFGDSGAVTFDTTTNIGTIAGNANIRVIFNPATQVFTVTSRHIYGHEGFYPITLSVHHGMVVGG